MTCGFNIYTTALNTCEAHNVQSEMCGAALAALICCLRFINTLASLTPQGHSPALTSFAKTTIVLVLWSIHLVNSTGSESNHTFFFG